MNSILKILDAREKRVDRIEELKKKYKAPILVSRVNMPGIDKNNELSQGISTEVNKLVKDKLKDIILFDEFINEGEGPIKIYVVNIDALELKKLTIDIEIEHPLGRCVDLDVYNENGEGISRRGLNLPSRKCFICDEDAHLCVRSQKHSEQEVKKYLEDKYYRYMKSKKMTQDEIEELSFKLGEYAIEGMLYESAIFPSPGLVSPVSNGAHRDMNYYTFLSSTAVLSKYMIKFAKEGFSSKPLKDIFSEIRKIGIKAEAEMFIKTENVNTHKGMIFLMGITVTAIAKVIYDGGTFVDIQSVIRTMTKGIVSEELKKVKIQYEKVLSSGGSFEEVFERKLTYGERLYIDYGIEGIRGEVENGLPVIFHGALEVYEDGKLSDEKIRLLKALVYIMSICEDSTILHRHSLEVLQEVREKSKEIFNINDEKEFFIALEKLDREFSLKKISPGGAADLLAITVLLSKSKRFFL